MDISIISDDDEIEIVDVVNVTQSTSHKSENSEVKLELVKKNNPVEENIIKQLHLLESMIDQTKNNIEIIKTVTDNVLQTISAKSAYQDVASSESDSDCYLSSGEPVIKKKKNKSYERQQVLKIKDVWQRVIDDKWIIGVTVQNTTMCKLQEPTIYICRKSQEDSCSGVSIFWSLIDDKIWIPSDEIGAEEELVATVVLDMPNFDEQPFVEAGGTVLCQFDDKLFQTALPELRLCVQDTVDGSCQFDLQDEDKAQASILALKAISVDRVVLLPLQLNAGTGKRLTKFLDAYSFTEVCKVCVIRNVGSLQYCLLEVLPTEDADIRVLLSARSEAQLSTIVQLMREYLPELVDVERQQAIDEAAEVLQQELQLYLTCNSLPQLQQARTKTDLLIP